ncbi:signal peptidase I [Jannaschia sp. 2305UL9-9]|uniref:signal peptidase I n=1 Tax=Jannaschia sp. 2305UL9-9 TaxID=3121638 RepID=UPI0035279D37
MTLRFGLAGTSGRGPLLGWTLAFQVAAVALVAWGPLDKAGPFLRLLAYGLFGFIFVAWIGAVVRRLHDLGRSGWFAVLFPLPIIGLGLLIWAILASPRPLDPARFAPAPRYVVGAAFLVLLALVLASRGLWVPHRVMATHMAPTLNRGQMILSVEAGLGSLKAGDLISFALRDRSAGMQVGRVIAVEGQTFALRQGLPIIDGVAAQQAPCPDVSDGCLVETLPNGMSHRIMGGQDGLLSDMEQIRVPVGAVYIMGDNRDTADPRGMASETGARGLLPLSAITGRVMPLPFGRQS